MATGVRRHKSDTKTFEELNFIGQARSINVQIVVLGRAIKANLNRAKQEGRDVKQVHPTRVEQVKRLRQRIEHFKISIS